MYKAAADEKYHFGPVWDFDWAYTFNYSNRESQSPQSQLLWNDKNPGAKFFKRIFTTPEFDEAFVVRWEQFKTEIWPALKEYMAEYHDLIAVAALQNGQVWPQSSLQSYVASSEDFEEYYQKLLDFLEQRIQWIDTASNHALF
jgi:hypothetical protein